MTNEKNLFPRRNCIDQFAPVEEAIWQAAGQIENLDADTRLTEALNFLWKAKDLVSDYLEDKKGLPKHVPRFNQPDGNSSPIES